MIQYLISVKEGQRQRERHTERDREMTRGEKRILLGDIKYTYLQYSLHHQRVVYSYNGILYLDYCRYLHSHMGVEIHMPVIKFHSRAIETPTFIVSKDSIVKVADTIILTRILKARVKCFTSVTSVWFSAGACERWKAITYSWCTATTV